MSWQRVLIIMCANLTVFHLTHGINFIIGWRLWYWHYWLTDGYVCPLVQPVWFHAQICHSQRKYIQRGVDNNSSHQHITFAHRLTITFDNAKGQMWRISHLSWNDHLAPSRNLYSLSHCNTLHLRHTLHTTTFVNGTTNHKGPSPHIKDALMISQKINTNHHWSFNIRHDPVVHPRLLFSAELHLQLHCSQGVYQAPISQPDLTSRACFRYHHIVQEFVEYGWMYHTNRGSCVHQC